ncbi:MAG: (2Fe-2S)-binding protein [Negativicutes bacterium]|nr:(2Fe-2S)-binding protein [Negativicutes bacterium]
MAFWINDLYWTGDVAEDRTLLAFLREDLGMTGTKCGCQVGECGACTVILEGVPVQSCLVLAVEADGKRVETVEGLAGETGELHPLQAAFLECFAVQCGFCSPGMLMAAKALLQETPQPTRPEILDALRGHLCRCTGYEAIVRAIERASGR